jgi:sec-independent protein translocase protein TatA
MFTTHSNTPSAYQAEGCYATLGGRVRHMGTPELMVVAVVVLVLFGGSQLPKLAKNLGAAQRELKKAMEEGKSDDSSSDKK